MYTTQKSIENKVWNARCIYFNLKHLYFLMCTNLYIGINGYLFNIGSSEINFWNINSIMEYLFGVIVV